MIAVFYDRKYGCEVWSDQLVPTRVVRHLRCGGGPQDDCPEQDGWAEELLGEIGYKSADCPDFQNYDRYLLLHDLVFLRLE